MASDIIARADAFSEKAEELADKGHLLRAAENFGLAAEAARALGEDNLVLLNMRLRQGNMLGCFALAPDAAAVDPRIRAAHRAESIALLSDAVAALGRRRAAGTLLEGKCGAAEEAWRAADFRRLNPDCPAAEAASVGALVGYDKFLQAAAMASIVLSRARAFAAECSSAQVHSFSQHVLHAVELMQQPRHHSDAPMNM